MHIINTTALISINETLIVQLVSFLIFLFVINRIMFRPLQQTMNDRDAYLERLGKEIAEIEEKIIAQSKEMDARQKAVREEAFAVSQKLEAAGQQQAAEIFSQTQNEIAALKAKEAKAIQAQIEAARRQLKDESKRLSLSIMEKVLDRRIAA